MVEIKRHPKLSLRKAEKLGRGRAELVLGKLPKKTQAALRGGTPAKEH